MNLTTTELHQLNVSRNKELNDENKEYYMNMASYIRTSNVSYQQSEEILLELIDHMIILQMQGRSAREVFGDEPKVYCDEIINQLNHVSWMERAILNFKLFSILFFIVSLSTSIAGFSYFDLNIFVQSLLLFFSILFTKSLLHKFSFHFTSKIKLILLMFIQSFFILLIYFQPFHLVLFKTNSLLQGAISFIFLLVVFYKTKKKMVLC